MTKVNQPPARYALFLARVSLLRMVAATLVWIGLFLFASKERPYSAHVPAVATLVVLAIGAGFVFLSAKARRARALVGARSERRVANALIGLRPVGLLNSTLLGAGGDADHILVGPWLAVIETKTGRGPTRYDGKQMFVGNHAIPGNPVSQVQRQARALRQVLDFYIDAVVCVVDMTNPPYTAETTTVCSLADLPGVIKSLSSRLDDTHASRIYEKLIALDLPAAPSYTATSPR